MTDSLMFQEDDYVVLRSGQPEEIVSAAEMLQELTTTLKNGTLDLPADVLKRAEADRPAYLLANYCELDLGIGQYLQWYAVRLEKN
jgi:Protein CHLORORESPIRATORY REDUCTION 7